MLKKTIAFTDFDGVQRVEDHYFNLTKAELFEMEVSADGNSFQEYLQKIVEANEGKQIMAVFKEILEKSYGVRSDDGKRFMKSKEIFKAFTETEAYSEFFFELVTDAEKMSAFTTGLMPVEVRNEASAEDLKTKLLAQKGGYNKPEVKDVNIVKSVPTEYVNTEDRKPLDEQEVGQLSREQLEAQLARMNAQNAQNS